MDRVTIFCPFCGEELLVRNAQFCGHCGNNVSFLKEQDVYKPTYEAIRPIPVSPDPQTPSTVRFHTPSPDTPAENLSASSPNRRHFLKLGVIGITSVATISAIGAGAFAITHQPSPTNSPKATPLGQTTNTPIMVLRGMNQDQDIYWSTFDGSNWAAQQIIPGIATTYSPTLASYRGELHMAWKGTNLAQSIYWSTFDGSKWATQQIIPGIATAYSPAFAILG